MSGELMTHPLTPREKAADRLCDKVQAEYPNILATLASGSGDHEELAVDLERMKRGQQTSDGTMKIADRCLVLLAENAALREKTKKLGLAALSWNETATEQLEHRDKAERKLAEAVGLLRANMMYPDDGKTARETQAFLSRIDSQKEPAG